MDKIISVIFQWQTLVGSFIGVIAPLLVLFLIEKYKKKRETKDYLYYLERMVVDQINLIIDIKTSINIFIVRINTLIKNIDENQKDAYSADTIFFPLFSARQLPDSINNKSSGSGYIDNKIAKAYSLSMDLPYIIDDLRLQLKETLEMNNRIVFNKLNSAEVQKEQYKRNILEYKRILEDDFLDKNIPLFLEKFVEVLVAIRKKEKISPISWKLKFDPRWKFYFKKNDFKKAQEEIISDMDKHFENETLKLINEINTNNH